MFLPHLDLFVSVCPFLQLRPSGKLLSSLQGRDTETPLLLESILQGVPGAWGSFPEMWQLGKRQVVWWLCDAVTFALGHRPGFRRLPFGSLQEISKQQKKRKGE